MTKRSPAKPERSSRDQVWWNMWNMDDDMTPDSADRSPQKGGLRDHALRWYSGGASLVEPLSLG